MESLRFWFTATVPLLVAVLLPSVVSTQESSGQAIRPARVAQIENLELDAARSNRPTYLPAEWGRLVSVQSAGEGNFWLFLEAANGSIYVVRMRQRGAYLYLDTSDQGGVTLMISRQP